MHGVHILVAEDNLINQKLILAILSKSGFSYKLVENGSDAINIFQAESFNIVLMDCQMPGVNGLIATTKIREFEHQNLKPRTPIIALTANAMNGDRERCLEAGMDDFLSKPFRRNELLKVIETWTSNNRMVNDETREISKLHSRNSEEY